METSAAIGILRAQDPIGSEYLQMAGDPMFSRYPGISCQDPVSRVSLKPGQHHKR